jgi:hypothetical protein
VDGSQQTAHMMQDDILKEPIPVATAPDWGVPVGTRLGIEIDENKLGAYHEFYQHNGSFLPFDPQLVGAQLYR